jgi:hypothetical protein
MVPVSIAQIKASSTFSFLRGIVESGPAGGVAPLTGAYYPCLARTGEYYLYFLDCHQPALADFDLPAGVRFTAEVIDPWAMTITRADGTYSGKCQLKMPGREMLAVRFRVA